MFAEVVAFLSPFFARENEREALLLNAFYGQEVVLRKVNYAGAASEFVPRLVRVLQAHGEVAPRMQALWQLLLTMRAEVGADRQRQIDTFQVWANTSHAVTLQPSDLAGSTIVNNDNRINISGNVQGGMVQIGGTSTHHGNVTITMGDMTQTIQNGSAAPSEKEQLQKLMDDLKAALQSVPAEHKANAELVSARTTALVQESSGSDVDPDSVKSKANRLQLAANNIKEVLPTVALIGASIVTQVLKMAGH